MKKFLNSTEAGYRRRIRIAITCVQLGFNEAPALYFSLSAISGLIVII
jgi:hypothetical protein